MTWRFQVVDRGTPEAPNPSGGSSRAEPGSKKRMRAVLGVSGIAVVAAIVAFGPVGRVRGVEVRGVEPSTDLAFLDEELVGKPLLLVSERQVADEVRRIPWVAEAETRRDFVARRVVVLVTRRSAAAAVRLSSGYLLYDAQGHAFAVTDSRPPAVLEVTGEIGPSVVGSGSREVADLVAAGSVLGRWSLEEVVSARWSDESGIELVLASGSYVRVGDVQDLDSKGRALRAMQERAKAEGWRVRTYTVVAPGAPALSQG